MPAPFSGNGEQRFDKCNTCLSRRLYVFEREVTEMRQKKKEKASN